MNRLILAGVAVLGCLTVACAQSAGTPALDNRSAAWKQNLALAVNDPTKVAGVMQSIPEADRAAFAADVLEVLQTKRQYMPDKAAWAQEFSATAAALIAGAGGAKNAVLSTVSAEIVNACVTGESHELASGDLAQLGILEKSTMLQLQGDDRVAFASAMLLAVGKQSTTDADVHKLAISTTALALVAGAGDAKTSVVADIFAVVPLADLGTVAQAFSDVFNQRKNSLGNDDYQQMALQTLQAVAARTAGQPGVVTGFAYVVATFVGGAANPAQFEQDLTGKLADLLAKMGMTQESLATALAAAKTDMAANAALLQTLYPTLSRKTVWGVIVLTPDSLLGWQVTITPPTSTGLRRPPPSGYQNQGI